MAKVVAGLMALVALGASVLSGADPWTCLARGAVAYTAGAVAGAFWEALARRVPGGAKRADREEADDQHVEHIAA